MVVEEVFWIAGFGFLGGLGRGLYGALKARARGEKMRWRYFVMTLVVSTVLGGLVGSMIEMDYKAAAILGYVGTDFLENIAKKVVPTQFEVSG